MIAAVIILFVMVAGFIMGIAVLAEPIELIVDTLIGVDATTGSEINDTMNLIKWAFTAAMIVGIFLAMLLFAVYGHKKEYET